MTRTTDALASPPDPARIAPARAASPHQAASPAPGRWPRLAGPALLAAYSAAYFGFALAFASARPLWTDEIITHHVARLAGPAAIWDVLSRGPEHSAPMYLLAAQACYRLMGASPMAMRLPAIVGVWAMSLALYRFVGRRSGPGAAWVALLLPFSTLAFDYVAEGRPYGLVLGLSGLSLVCWQQAGCAATRRGRAASRVALWCCLAGAVFSHYFAVLCLVPLGMGELVRTFLRRRVAWGTWAAIVGGLAPLPACLPFIRYASTFSHNFWARNAEIEHAPLYYEMLMGYDTMPGRGILPPMIAALGVAAFASWIGARRWSKPATPEPVGPPLEELVAAAGFAILPVVGIALVRVATEDAIFTVRYALPAIIGLSALVAYAASALGHRVGLGRILAACLAGWIAYRVAFAFHHLPESWEYPGDPGVLAEAGEPGEPIAMQQMHPYQELAFYGPDRLRSRLVTIVGIQDTSAEELTRRMAPLAASERPLRVEEYDDFVARHRRFLVSDLGAGALLDRLIADGADVALIRSDAELTLYRVTLPGPGPAAPGDPRRVDSIGSQASTARSPTPGS